MESQVMSKACPTVHGRTVRPQRKRSAPLTVQNQNPRFGSPANSVIRMASRRSTNSASLVGWRQRLSQILSAVDRTQRRSHKIRVRGHDRKIVRSRELPDLAIRSLRQIKFHNMPGTRVQFRQSRDQFARKVLVKKELHKATRLPMWAAKS